MKSLLIAALAAPIVLAGGLAVAQEAPPAPAAPAESAAKTKVARGFEVGTDYGFRLSGDNSQESPQGNQRTTVKQDLKLTVEKVAESGVVTFTGQYVRIHGHNESMMGSIEFDSNSEYTPTGNPQVDLQMIANTIMAGHEFRVELAADGTWKVLEGVDAAIDAALEDEPFLASMVDSLKADQTSQLVNVLSALRPAYPEDGIAADATWRNTTDLTAGPMQITMAVDYTVKELGKESAKLGFGGEITMAAAEGPQKPMIEQFLMMMETTKKDIGGIGHFAMSDGMCESSDVTSEIQLEMQGGGMGGGMGGGGGGMTIVIKSTQKVARVDPSTFVGKSDDAAEAPEKTEPAVPPRTD